ncbi:MAG: hypothetical protein IKE01_01070 [Clostridia bacterium]|nr:hypothetical protein [Clostridia bacterium]
MAKLKTQCRYMYECHEEGDTLILSLIKVDEVYELTQTVGVAGKINTESTLVDEKRTVINQFVLNKTTAEEVARWREDPEARGIVFRKKGMLYACPIEGSKDMKRLESYAHTNMHLCGANCKCICPKDEAPCPKVLNVKCNHIEKYDFIIDGYELFAPHVMSVFYVLACANYVGPMV